MNYGCGGSISEFVQHNAEWEAAYNCMLTGMTLNWTEVTQTVSILSNAHAMHAAVLEVISGCAEYPTFLDAYRQDAISMEADKDKTVSRVNPLTMGEYAPFVLDSSMGLSEFQQAAKSLYTDDWFSCHPNAAGVVLFDLVCTHATFTNEAAFAVLFALSPFTVGNATKTIKDAHQEMKNALALAPDDTAILVVCEAPTEGLLTMLDNVSPVKFHLNCENDANNLISLVGIGGVELRHNVSTDIQMMIAGRPRHVSWSTRVVAAIFNYDGGLGIAIGVHWKYDPNLENYERDIVNMLRWARTHHNVDLFICSGDFNIKSTKDLSRLAAWLKPCNISIHPGENTTVKTRSLLQGQPSKANVRNSKPSLFECRWGAQPESHKVMTGSTGAKATPNTGWMFDHGAISSTTTFE
jgi:hypothetical protein